VLEPSGSVGILGARGISRDQDIIKKMIEKALDLP